MLIRYDPDPRALVDEALSSCRHKIREAYAMLWLARTFLVLLPILLLCEDSMPMGILWSGLMAFYFYIAASKAKEVRRLREQLEGLCVLRWRAEWVAIRERWDREYRRRVREVEGMKRR